MEQWRLVLAIAISILIFIAWDLMFVERREVQPPSRVPATIEELQDTPRAVMPDTTPAIESIDPPMETEGIPGRRFGTITVQTPLYTAQISEKGAALTSFILETYREAVEEDSPKKQMIPHENQWGTALIELPEERTPQMAGAVYTTSVDEDRVVVTGTHQTVTFFTRTASNILIEKKFTFFPDSYKINIGVLLNNRSGQPLERGLEVLLANPAPDGKGGFSFEGPFAHIDGALEQIKMGDIAKKSLLTGDVAWAGMTDRYFMTAVVPESPGDSGVRLSHNQAKNLVEVRIVQPSMIMMPDGIQPYSFCLFLGPKRIPDLAQCGGSLEKAVDFGFFDIIAKPCLWLMNQIYDRAIPNYGVAIILLTMLIKLIFWPLGSKSYKSMAEMKKLQPLMTDIRKKYKDDKKKMNEEVMNLYRTYKVNPMSGCLPMLVQIPVFIAFYRMLYESIELRHAPFWLWINDLSAPDRLFQFDITIPLMHPPFGIPVLTIIMGATMFLQQKLSPPPGDPTQARIMMMMPIIFTFIFINFPSGLVLYWLVNNVLSIAQQYYITKKLA
ncbi:MAG: membrane protein insertase YidC [Desulfobacteraceae bacterium]|jgi:YidC/Oxa1 family membrane protein insertase|nr:MAG: membrane protein insertase YidC [Desulfobacteraceae bacterium]